MVYIPKLVVCTRVLVVCILDCCGIYHLVVYTGVLVVYTRVLVVCIPESFLVDYQEDVFVRRSLRTFRSNVRICLVGVRVHVRVHNR